MVVKKSHVLICVFLLNALNAGFLFAETRGLDPVHRALDQAVVNGDIQGIIQAINQGADVNQKDNEGGTVLMVAVMYDRRDSAELLLSKGADVNVKDNQGMTALMLAAMKGHKDVAELLLSKGADLNARTNFGGITALIYATLGGDKDIVGLLLSKGADVNAKTNAGHTALSYAEGSKNKNKDTIIDLLKKAGAT